MFTCALIPTSGPSVTIFDGNKSPFPDACSSDFLPDDSEQVQITPGFRSANPAMFYRFNRYYKWTAPVCHSFSSIQACQDFTGQHPAIPRSGIIQLINRNGQGAFTRYLLNAVIQTAKPTKKSGLTVWFSYVFLYTSYSLTI